MDINGALTFDSDRYQLKVTGLNYAEGFMISRFLANCSLSVLQLYLDSALNHIRFVREAGLMIGVPKWRLWQHDASKFSPLEFASYAINFFGDDLEKAANKLHFDYAWLSHQHKNDHHWQHWLLPYDNGQRLVLPMPASAALEMIADWMGASMAYTGSWDMRNWLEANMGKIRLHPDTAHFVSSQLAALGYADIVNVHKWAK